MTKKSALRLILNSLIFFLSLIFWFFLKNSFESAAGWDARIIYPLAAFSLFGTFWGLYLLLETEKKFLILASFLSVLSFIFAYSADFFSLSAGSLGGLAVIILAFFCLWGGAMAARSEKNLRYEISPAHALRRGFRPTMTAIALLSALVFFWSPYSRVENRALLLPQSVFNQLSAPIIQALGGKEIDSQTAIGRQNIASLQNQLYDSFNIQVNALSASYKTYIPVGLALTFFFTVKFFGMAYYWLMIFFSWLVFQMLLALKIIKIRTEEVLKEIIEV